MAITRHAESPDKRDIWAQLSAPLPVDVISWRQDGRATQRDGKYYARFVCYIEANTVRERLDTVVPGEWDLTLELLPAVAVDDADDPTCAFKARLSILGVIREDVGSGRDYKSAATDAFKRAGVRFGVGHELYAMEQNWVQVDGDGKFAKPVEDPSEAYARKQQRSGVGSGVKSANAVEPSRGQRAESVGGSDADVTTTPARQQPAPESSGPLAADEPSCPKCGGRLWDNRLSKRNPKAPDWKCRSRSCDGVIWPPKSKAQLADEAAQSASDFPPDDERELPF
jgi:hypothetical protein